MVVTICRLNHLQILLSFSLLGKSSGNNAHKIGELIMLIIRPHFYKYLVDVDAGKINVLKCIVPSRSSFEVFKARVPPKPKISYSSIITFPIIILPPSKYPISSSPIKMRHIHRSPLSPTPTISFNNKRLVFPTISIPT